MQGKLKLFLIRLAQFMTILLYSFFVMTYFGAIVLLPLTFVYWLSLFFGLLLPSLLAGIIALGVAGFLGLNVCRMTEIYKTIACGGMQLIDLGYAQVQRLGDLLLEKEAAL